MKKTDIPVNRNQIIQLEINSLNTQGQGVGRYSDFAIFVPFALKGEVVKAIIIKVYKNYAVAKLLEIISESADRVEPKCKHFKKCGGCMLQHLDQDGQADFKRQQVSDAFKRIAKIDVDVKFEKAEKVWNYRNKASFPVRDNPAKFGYFAVHSHNLIEIEQCPIQSDEVTKLAQACIDFFNKNNIPGYNELENKGIIRHIVIRTNTEGEIMLIIVAKTEFKLKEKFVQEILAGFPAVKSIMLNINTKNNNVIMSNKFKTIFGQNHILQDINGLTFEISANSFLQVNIEQTERLYSKAIELAQLTSEDNVIDAYCGVGTISLLAAQNAKKVIGIENVEQAIDNAKKNAVRNKIDNVEFICNDAEEEIEQQLSKNNIDAIFLDPPRKGCEKRFIEAILKSDIKKVVYISCDPATLARDCSILSEKYSIKECIAYDMFPQTSHVETVCVLESV